MSKYGIDFYGPPTVYGEIPLITFDARPVTAVSTDYGEIKVTWHTPTGSWDRLRLTRDTAGFSPRADMGTMLVDASSVGATPPTEFLDTGLTEGQFYYYTVWVHDVTIPTLPTWKRAGDVIGLAVQDWGHSSRMFALVPMIYRDKDAETPDNATGRGQLERFLDIPGFQADHIRTEFETLKSINDPDKVSGGLLPLMARQLGFGYEADLGMRLARTQMKNAVHIYKHKGAAIGVEALVSSLTGWAPTITIGRNLALDQNDAAAATSTGRWTNVANATVGRRRYDDVSAPGALSGGGIPGTPAGASTGDVGAGSWMLLLTALGAGDMVVQSFPAGTSYNNRTWGIPVAGSLPYTISVYSRALDTVRSVRIGVEWFDINGVSLGAVTENTAASNSTSLWTRHVYTVTSPANARFMRVQLRAQTAILNDRIGLGALQVEQGSAATAYQSARSIRIQFAADRVNLVPNPSGEVNTTGWTTTGTSAFVADTAQFRDGVQSFKLTATGGNMSMQTAAGAGGMAVTPLRYYIASAYDFKPSGTVRQIRVDIIWYTAAGATISTTTGTAVDQTVGSWSRAYVLGLAPATAAFAAVMVTILAAGAAEIHWVDSVLMESGTMLLDYFDGSSYSAEGEYMWDQAVGTPGNARSHFYSRRLIKNYRLNTRLVEFLPAGSTYALLYSGQT